VPSPRRVLIVLAVAGLWSFPGPPPAAARAHPHRPSRCEFEIGLSVPEARCLRAYLIRRARYEELVAALRASASSARRAATAAEAAITSPPSTGIDWDAIAECESGGDWAANTGTFDGGLQFHPSTWLAAGGGTFAPYAWQASRAQQITVAEWWVAAVGCYYCPAGWPVCGRFG
jgi:hypothetical protein